MPLIACAILADNAWIFAEYGNKIKGTKAKSALDKRLEIKKYNCDTVE